MAGSYAGLWRNQEHLVDAIQTIEETSEDLKSALADPSLAQSGYVELPAADDVDCLRHQLDELRESWTQFEAARGMNESYRKIAAGQRITRRPWFLTSLVVGVSFPVVISVLYSQPVVLSLGVVLAALGAVTLVLDAIARARFQSAQSQAELHLERMHRDAETRFWQAAKAVQIDPANVETELLRLEQSFERMSTGAGA